jgi:hydrogenase-4 component F
MELETVLLGIPLITMLAILIAPSLSWIGRINTLGMLILLGIGVMLVMSILDHGPLLAWGDLIYMDALSGLMVLLVSLISFLASLYSMGYMGQDVEAKIHTPRRLKGYYLLFDLFVLTMLLVCVTNNLGVLWVAIEATTLASALLVGYTKKKPAVDAAWRYLMICAVGISFALVGIVLTYYSAIQTVGHREKGLNWSYLLSVASQLDPTVLKLAFVFVLIGFGTKAGLAPMHTWLPDAHSEAPTPISALLSGVLIKCSFYGILRFTILVNQSVDQHFTSQLLLIFGILSLGIAAPFILIQTNIKRLLAYHSIEHMGIITVGTAFGSPLAVYAALLHIFNHAMTKSLLFFVAGNLSLKYHTKEMERMSGAIRVMPVTGLLLLIGGLALAGTPPFSIFTSEWLILTAGIEGYEWLACSLFILFLVIIFGGLVHHFSRIAFGVGPAPGNEAAVLGEVNRLTVLTLWLPLLFIVVMGWVVPGPLHSLLLEATKIVSQIGQLPNSLETVAGIYIF